MTGYLVRFRYTNHRGETGARVVRPMRLWYGRSEWHAEDGWILDAYDTDRKAMRSFLMRDVSGWEPWEATRDEAPAE